MAKLTPDAMQINFEIPEGMEITEESMMELMNGAEDDDDE